MVLIRQTVWVFITLREEQEANQKWAWESLSGPIVSHLNVLLIIS